MGRYCPIPPSPTPPYSLEEKKWWDTCVHIHNFLQKCAVCNLDGVPLPIDRQLVGNGRHQS